MFKRLKMGDKIALYISSLVLFSIVVMCLFVKLSGTRIVRQNVLNELVATNEIQAKELGEFYLFHQSVLKSMASSDQWQRALADGPSVAEALRAEKAPQVQKAFAPYAKLQGVLGLSVVASSGKVLQRAGSGHSPKEVYLDPSGFDYQQHDQKEVFLGGIYRENGQPRINAYARQTLGGQSHYLILHLSAQPIVDLLHSSHLLGETAESVLVREQGGKLVFVHRPRFVEVYTAASGVAFGGKEGHGLQLAARGAKGVYEVLDYRGESVLAAWRPVPHLGWGVVTKVDATQPQTVVNGLMLRLIFSGVVLIIFVFVVSLGISKYFLKKVIYLKKMLQYLSKGILPNVIETTESEDELGEMTATVGEVVNSLKRTAAFAHEIGEGNYSTDYRPLSDEDILGSSLLSMRESIQASDERDNDRNWIVSGVAEIGNILRQNDKLDAIGDRILEYVTERVGAVQGAFYVMDGEGADARINLRSCFAYQKKKYTQAQFRVGEGLVGQAVAERDIVFRTEIPREYVHITSGLLGDMRPESLLIVPLITDEEVYGVLELAAFHKFTERQVTFVREINLIIARTIFNIKVNDRTMALLRESREMGQELQEKQEILRQNAEEMQATQEELQRTNSQLEEQIAEVGLEQYRTQMLLENASEVITTYERDGAVRYVSPSVERILGYGQDELRGTDLVHYVLEEDKQRVREAFEELVLNPHRSMSLQYRVRRRDGEVLWVEVAGNNLLSNPAVKGLVVNTRDITVRLKAEREERMRSKMQSLSENSLDLIARLDVEGTIFYINPTIQSLTGQLPAGYLNKSLDQVEIPEEVAAGWNQVIEEVKQTRAKTSRELAFPVPEGKRIMQLNAIPEFDAEEKIESILLVSHDITEQKLIETEIKTKNKKITESINYARRIQGAILPDEDVIHGQLPDSFIVYKARDVVSGDFPWYLEVDGQLFIAAVDCTGHGVPGALISLIGYFLLNDIVRSQGVSDPGQILDQLDQEVTKTLRQDAEGATGKDGMDIALCKIDKRAGTVEFAGAHRPLFWMHDGELEVIKGNKFPIGGGRYRNQTNFDSHCIPMQAGDSIYFCSDGYIDQFGGEQVRKFGSRRLRNLIAEVASKDMEAQYEEFSSVWENWKGTQKQTDDMLLIGIKF